MVKLKIDGLGFSYGKKKILNDINLELDGPGLVCIVGPNGVGKSTLVKCINRILKQSEGTISIDGRDTSEMSLKELSMKVGYVPPSSDDLFSMPVIDTILVGRHNHQKWRTTDRDIAVANGLLNLLNMEEYAMQGYNELSAGQHQKVTLARGLASEAPILLLDEPTSNLDVRHQVYVIEMLRALSVKLGLLIIMISHDLNLSAKYAHCIVMMSAPGIIRSIGTPSEVITEKSVREVYGVECEVIDHGGYPLVILGSALNE